MFGRSILIWTSILVRSYANDNGDDMSIIINDDDKCVCGAYWQGNGYCCKGHPKAEKEPPGLTHKERYERIYNRIILNTAAKFEKDEERVVWLLKNYPGTKGDDRLLEFRYRSRFEGIPFPPRFFDRIELNGEIAPRFKTLTASETITRCRRTVQYTWGIPELLPSREVLRKRGLRENQIELLFSGQPLEYAKKF